MSMSITSYVVYGVAVEQKDISKSITKYDEDTGRPYQKVIKEKCLVLSSTEQKINTDDDFDAYEIGSFGEVASDYNRYDNRVIGTILAKSDTMQQVNFYPEDVDVITVSKLATLGITESPSMYIITHYGY